MDNQSRRGFLKSSMGIIAGMSVLKVGAKNLFGKEESNSIPVGLQLYSVRKDCAKDLAKTIAAVARMGYDGVEFAGYYDHTAKEIRTMLDDNELKCCGTHTQLTTLQGDELEKTIEFNQTIGNKYLIVPWLPEEKRKTADDWKKVAELFNELAEKVKPHGMMVGYHNHTFEFQAFDGKVPWDIFAKNTIKDVILQIDTGNCMSGGGDPLSFMEKYPGRSVTVHLKEFSKTNKNALIGEGDVDWKKLMEICQSTGGTEWYIIEEEKDAYPPIEGVEKSLKNLKKLIG